MSPSSLPERSLNGPMPLKALRRFPKRVEYEVRGGFLAVVAASSLDTANLNPGRLTTPRVLPHTGPAAEAFEGKGQGE